MYVKDDVTGKVTEPAECVSFTRPDKCDMHDYCHHCMVYKPEYGLLTAKDHGAGFEACRACCMEGCCEYYDAFGCKDKCEARRADYGAECEALCADNALEHVASPLKEMLTKKR